MKILVLRSAQINNFLQCCLYLNKNFKPENFFTLIQKNVIIPKDLPVLDNWTNIENDEKPFTKKKLDSISFPELNDEDMIVIPVNNNEADGYNEIVSFFLQFKSKIYFWTLHNELYPVSNFEKIYFKNYEFIKLLNFVILLFLTPYILIIFILTLIFCNVRQDA